MEDESGQVWRRWEGAVLSALAVPLLVALAALAYRSTLYVNINYNEGWNAFQAAAAMSGGVLYPPPSALITNNYPPLSFYLVGSVASIIGDAVFAGRLIAWIAFLGVAASIGMILRRLGNDRLAALFGAMLFLGYAVVHFDYYVGMDDPQWFAHVVMMMGPLIYFRAPDSPRASVAAGVLMGAALFIKHNIVALPLTFFLWLLVFDRRAGLRFAAAGLATGAAGLVLCVTLFGNNFIQGLLAPREYSAVEIYRRGLTHLSDMQVPLAIAVLGGLTARDRFTMLFLGCLVAALVIGAIQLSGAGVNFNSMFEAVIAFSLMLGHLTGRWIDRPLRLWTFVACGVALLVATGLAGNQRIFLVRPWLQEQNRQEASTLRAVRLIAQQSGPAVCETIVLCYWAHKDFAFDPFNYNQGVRAGLKDGNAVLRQIEAGTYSAVQITLQRSENSLPRNAREALIDRYRPGPLLGPDSPAGVLYFQ